MAETAQTAGISPQYLSEIEPGRKEPSGEMIAVRRRRDQVTPRQQTVLQLLHVNQLN